LESRREDQDARRSKKSNVLSEKAPKDSAKKTFKSPQKKEKLTAQLGIISDSKSHSLNGKESDFREIMSEYLDLTLANSLAAEEGNRTATIHKLQLQRIGHGHINA
jgi:hypothetical protein